MSEFAKWTWLTAEVFFRWKKMMGLDWACPKCKSGDTSHYVDTGSDDGFVPRSSTFVTSLEGTVSMGQSRHNPCVRTTCVRCGYIELYSMYVIEHSKAKLIGPSLGPIV